jgi:pyrroloquinoline quinone (PQQ) biosynthesis protein C
MFMICSKVDSMNSRRLLAIYDDLPVMDHPYWRAVIDGELTVSQVLQAEVQHFLRSKNSRGLRANALGRARETSQELFDLLLETFIEECTDQRGTNHLELVRRLLIEGGLNPDRYTNEDLKPGNTAAIALYREISERGPEHHMLGAGVVEYYYSKLCPKVFGAYTQIYGMSEKQAETYRIHGTMDQDHANRALATVDAAVNRHGFEEMARAVRDALVATSLHYDGMLQGALGHTQYWDGK